jgi:hypothetical protein
LRVGRYFLICVSSIERVLVVLRDGKKLIGVLRSYDQYGIIWVEEGGQC